MSLSSGSLAAALALALAVSLAGCGGPTPLGDVDGGSGDAGPDAWTSPDDAWSPPDAWHFAVAPHEPTALVPNQGGVILAHPQLVVITYADDPNRDTIEAYASWMASSTWLTSVGAEYGVGGGTVLANVRLTTAAPDTTTTPDIQAMLRAGIDDGTLPRAADGSFHDVLYVVYFPAHTTISDPDLGTSCMSYGGYHYETPATSGLLFSYAVIPACSGFNPSLTDLEFIEEATSHEVIEAATDALPVSMPAWAYSQGGPDYSPWLYVGSELADLCALRIGPSAAYREGPWVATRMWSNAAAMAGDRDPCIPDSGQPYRAVSITPSTIQFVAAGASMDFALDAWTTAPVADFTLYAAAAGGTFVPSSVSIDRTTVNNGDHATLTVGVPAGTASGTYALVYVEVVTSGTEYDGFPVVVVVP